MTLYGNTQTYCFLQIKSCLGTLPIYVTCQRNQVNVDTVSKEHPKGCLISQSEV